METYQVKSTKVVIKTIFLIFSVGQSSDILLVIKRAPWHI